MKLTLGTHCIAEINGKQVGLANALYQSWKSHPAPFTVDDVTFTKVTKHSTQILAKAWRTRWYTFTDGTMMEVAEDSEYIPTKPIESICWRSVKTIYDCTTE